MCACVLGGVVAWLVVTPQIKKRNRDGPGRGRGQNSKQNAQNAHAAQDDHGGASSGEDTDDNSYGSQGDRRSDQGGYRGRE